MNFDIQVCKASRWAFLKARLFGWRSVWVEDGWKTEIAHYKGYSYILSHKRLDE